MVLKGSFYSFSDKRISDAMVKQPAKQLFYGEKGAILNLRLPKKNTTANAEFLKEEKNGKKR